VQGFEHDGDAVAPLEVGKGLDAEFGLGLAPALDAEPGDAGSDADHGHDDGED
jgi:hypothetical protein